MHIGRRKLIASHGVLYGMIVYAANKPKAQSETNIAKRCRALTKAINPPSAESSIMGASVSIPHSIYAQIPFCVWSLVPVFVQSVYASIAPLTPPKYVKKDEKKRIEM